MFSVDFQATLSKAKARLLIFVLITCCLFIFFLTNLFLKSVAELGTVVVPRQTVLISRSEGQLLIFVPCVVVLSLNTDIDITTDKVNDLF